MPNFATEVLNEDEIKSKSKVTYLKVIDDSYEVYDDSSYDDEDEWSSPDVHVSHSISLLKIVSEKENYDVLYHGQINKKKEYFLLYAIYETGDSFHRETGRIEFIDVFDDKNKAVDNQKILKEATKNKEHSTTLVSNGGVNYAYFIPWIGYFEDLTDLVFMTITVE